MVYVKRLAIAALSTGWLFELITSVTGVARYVTSPPALTSFPVVDFMRDGFTRSIVWLALVVAYWTWRYRGRLWWLALSVSVAGLVPTLFVGGAFFEQVKMVYGNGVPPLVAVPGGHAVVLAVGTQVLVVFAWWLGGMLAFWAWRLSASPADPARSA